MEVTLWVLGCLLVIILVSYLTRNEKPRPQQNEDPVKKKFTPGLWINLNEKKFIEISLDMKTCEVGTVNGSVTYYKGIDHFPPDYLDVSQWKLVEWCRFDKKTVVDSTREEGKKRLVVKVCTGGTMFTLVREYKVFTRIYPWNRTHEEYYALQADSMGYISVGDGKPYMIVDNILHFSFKDMDYTIPMSKVHYIKEKVFESKDKIKLDTHHEEVELVYGELK